jgi:hypothetical protein
MFQDFKLLMLSKFVFASRCLRFVVIVLCLVSANFQQVMSLGHGDSSRSSSTAKRRISSHDDVQNESISSSSCWITMEKKEAMIPSIFQHFVWPDWVLFFSVICFVILFQDFGFTLREFEEYKKSSQARLQAAEKESSNFKLKVDQQNSKLHIQFRSLFQEISHLKAELDVFSSHFNSLDSSPGISAVQASGHVRQVPATINMQSQKCAVKAFGPFSKVPADNLSKQNLATMALVPVRQVPPAQQSSCVPEQTNTVAFMSAVVASTSEAAANKVVRKGNGFQVEQSLVSKEISNPGGVISKEENRSGRPVPGSSSFRLNRVDPSTAQVKKLLSGDYLTFYMGNLSYRANDVTLKTAIENRFPITVDQAVVAYSSDGRSRGCAFVTVRWKEYLNSFSDPNSQSLVQKFCHSLTGKPLFGRPVFVELACNQRRGG